MRSLFQSSDTCSQHYRPSPHVQSIVGIIDVSPEILEATRVVIVIDQSSERCKPCGTQTVREIDWNPVRHRTPD